MKTLLIRLSVAAVLTGSVQAAPQLWKKPSSTWTDAQVRGFLARSPWSGSARITYTKMIGARARPIEQTARVSWTSAPPVRQAFVNYYRSLKGWEGFLPHLDRMLTRPPSTYTVALKLTGESADRDRHQKPLSRMLAETQLFRKNKPVLKALGVETWNDPGSGPRGDLVLVYTFPATDPITLDDKEVRFFTRICGFFWVPGTDRQACSYDITKTFKLKDMVIDGQLVL